MLRQMLRRMSSDAPVKDPAPPAPADRIENAVPAVCFQTPGSWYSPLMVSAAMVGAEAQRRQRIEGARALLLRLTPDDYARFMTDYYAQGLARFGDAWVFADIVTVLLALTEWLKPRRYLEVGVRRGRSACAVASLAPTCTLALFDMWVENYAGMANPGADFVRAELARIGHRGDAVFVDGDSHATLKRYFRDNPDAVFDLITIDGDHSEAGATEDIRDVLPHLAIGGALVLDDIAHPAHPELSRVWHGVIENEPRFSTWMFDGIGYGVGFALRKW
jgi:predicted O-methyltransferase YrrM